MQSPLRHAVGVTPPPFTGEALVRQKNSASQQQAQLALLSGIKFQGVKAFVRLKAIRTLANLRRACAVSFSNRARQRAI